MGTAVPKAESWSTGMAWNAQTHPRQVPQPWTSSWVSSAHFQMQPLPLTSEVPSISLHFWRMQHWIIKASGRSCLLPIGVLINK